MGTIALNSLSPCIAIDKFLGILKGRTMTNLKWKIDKIRTVLFFNNKIDFKKRDWSILITGKDVSNEIKQEENGIEQQYIEMTNLDEYRQFNLIFVKEGNVIDLQDSFEKDINFYSYDEISYYIKDFSERTQKIYQHFNNDIIRIGRVVELSIPLEGNIFASNLLKKDVSYFSKIDDDLEEISFRVNKSKVFNNIKVNQVIHYAEGQKMSISFDPQMGMPKANVQKQLILNIDLNTDAAHRSPLSVKDVSDFLEEGILNIVENGGVYASR